MVVDEYRHTVHLEQMERGGGVYLDGVLQPGAWFARPVRAAGLGQLKSWWTVGKMTTRTRHWNRKLRLKLWRTFSQVNGEKATPGRA